MIIGCYRVTRYCPHELKKMGFIVIELSKKSPSVSPLISSAFAPYPLFQWQSKEVLLNLGMKC